MSTHVSDDLPRLLTGDATRDETLAAAVHLRECPDCQQELVAAVVAHASLSSARRVTAPRVVPFADADVEVETGPAPLPDLSGVFAKVRDEAAQAGRAHKRRRVLVAVAAAAVLATAGGVTIAETVGDSGTRPDATVQLLSLPDGPRASAEVTVTGDRMHVDATSLPKLDGGHQYEVWLVADTDLRPLGYVGGDRTADLIVPASVMGQYDSVAISVQKNTEVEFSGDVVVRGSYA